MKTFKIFLGRHEGGEEYYSDPNSGAEISIIPTRACHFPKKSQEGGRK